MTQISDYRCVKYSDLGRMGVIFDRRGSYFVRSGMSNDKKKVDLYGLESFK